tara:strand:- start:2690 stop:2815 length:126 start_codon:yes stop_codon:yes gene_type:complete
LNINEKATKKEVILRIESTEKDNSGFGSFSFVPEIKMKIIY